MDEEEIESIADHRVDEFDVGTRISVMSDGSLRLALPSMPPSWTPSRSPFDGFTDALSAALGVRAVGLDKELYAIPRPAPDTLERLRAYLLQLRRGAAIPG